MKLIVGLGNPGKKYEKTRHNAGFRVLDILAERTGGAFAREKYKARFAEGALPQAWQGPAAGDGRLLLLQPQTYMNLSGEPVASFAGYYKIARPELLVVVDDVAIPVGALRLRVSGSAGGHNGLKDIERAMGGLDYARLRVGVGGRDGSGEKHAHDLADHVLGRFSAEEEKVMEDALKRAADACLVWAGYGANEAMNRFNTKKQDD
ncbi:MAG: aminoacyl-tRNA hydrolase [Planctomycetes bacterium]|nr:aminoacyl-tRNA hydrolase [Planctomycetota bacterium]